MIFDPYVKALLHKLRADAEMKSVTLDMRREATKSLQPQSGAARIRLSEESTRQLKIASDLAYLLYMIDQREAAGDPS